MAGKKSSSGAVYMGRSADGKEKGEKIEGRGERKKAGRGIGGNWGKQWQGDDGSDRVFFFFFPSS